MGMFWGVEEQLCPWNAFGQTRTARFGARREATVSWERFGGIIRELFWGAAWRGPCHGNVLGLEGPPQAVVGPGNMLGAKEGGQQRHDLLQNRSDIFRGRLDEEVAFPLIGSTLAFTSCTVWW